MKIFCVGRNYAAHAAELGNETPEAPVIFMKPETALFTDGDQFCIPPFTTDLHYEAELVVQISKRGKNIQESEAASYYEQITVGIDFTARDLQSQLKSKGLPWEKAKAFDQSALVGKWTEEEAGKSLQELEFSLNQNEKEVQHGRTELMIFPVNYLIAHISQYFTLEAGDLIFTGTPQGVGPCKAGDTLEGFLEGKKCFELTIGE